MNTKQIQDKLKKLGQEERALHKELKIARGRQLIKCLHKDCGKRSKVSNLTYIQTNYYVSPWGCTGGDYWAMDEGQFVCPHCNHTNRLYERGDIVALKDSFKEIIQTH